MKAKKVLAMLMASAMIMGTTVTAFAAEGTAPSESDAAIVNITGVNAGATYEAYQIIDARYDEDGQGFVEYVWADGMPSAGQKVPDPAKDQITSDMITALAKNHSNLTAFDNNNNPGDGNQFNPNENALPVGTWMILVTPGADDVKIYNPMIVSVYYDTNTSSSSNNDMISGAVNADSNWGLATLNAYAKSSNVEDEVSKEVDDPQVSKKDDVGFTLKGTIPSYSKNYYENVTYTLTDTIVNGLQYKLGSDNIVEVTVKNGQNVLEKDKDYVVSMKDNNKSFSVAFTKDYIFGLADQPVDNRKVTVEYTATITDEAYTTNGENNVKVTYTNKPGETTTSEPKTKYTYTASLDGVLQKVGVGDDANGLAGATFTLYGGVDSGYANADAVVDAIKENELESFDQKVTDNTYDIEFKGLDLDQYYYLRETGTPEGYSINDTIFEIYFDNLVYEQSGVEGENKLESYTVHVRDMSTGSELKEGGFVIEYGVANGNPVNVENTKLSDLPSTGGIGTTIFTIGGCVIMVTAAGLYFATRKKEQN